MNIIYKIVAKAITFRKIAIVTNGNNLMFQVIFIFSDWTLIEQIIASSHPFRLGGKTDFQKILPGILSGHWVMSKKSVDSMIF